MDRDKPEVLEKREDTGSAAKGEKVRKKTAEFIVLIRGRNCEKTIEKCLRSIKRQTYPYWRAIVILDAPTDGSFDITLRIAGDDDRIIVIDRNRQFGLCKSMYHIIEVAKEGFKPKDTDVAVIIDADDYVSKNTFFTVEEIFRKHPETLIVHGSYKKLSKGRRTKVSSPYPKRGNVRKLPWRGSHLKAIKWKIIKKVKPEWFQHNGKWLEAASDLALMFPCIELAGLNRVRHNHKVIYYWNDHMTKRKKITQKKCEKILRSKKPVA